MTFGDRARGVALGLLAFCIYLKTLCPTVYEGDSGELLAAVSSLGVSHPTGFPLYMLLVKLVSYVPIGDFALRANLVSALFAAGTVSITWFTARSLGLDRAPAAGTALFLAFSTTLWSHATAARVYSMTAFFIASLLFILARWMRGRDERLFYLFGLVLGLGLGTHVTVLLVLPAAIVIVAGCDRDTLRSPVLVRAALLTVIVGASLYLYVPLRAARDPAMNWSEPRDVGSLLYYLTQREYASIMGMHGPRAAAGVLAQACRGAFLEFTALGFAFVIAGVYVLWKRSRSFLLASTLVVAGNLLLLMNYGYASIGEVFPIHRYFYPSYLVLVLWLGFGLQWAAKYVASRELRYPALGTALVLAMSLVPLALHFREEDRSANRIVRNFGANLLASVPEGGILFTKGDAVSGSVWYLQIVERSRPDVVHIQRDLLTQDWYARQVARRHPDIVPADLPALPRSDRWRRLVDANLATRPVFSTSLDLDHYQNVPYGLVVCLVPPGVALDTANVATIADQLQRSYALDGVLDERVHKDVMVREMVRFYSKGHSNLGVFCASAGLKSEARREFEEALRFDPDNVAGLYNLGSLCIAEGDVVKGRTLIDRAEQLARGERGSDVAFLPVEGGPTPEAMAQAEAAVQSGIEFGRAGDHARAIAEFRRAISLDSLFVPAWLSLGTAYMNTRSIDDAVKSYERAIALDPGQISSLAYLNLGMVYANVKGDPSRARQHLERFLQLNPDDPRDEAIRAEIARLSSLPPAPPASKP